MIKFGAIVIAAVVVVCSFIYVAAVRSSEKMTTITVEEKDSVTVSNGDDGAKNQYRIYTDKGVYVVEDTILYWNFRAADRYAELKVGKTYECKQAYWRIGVLSMFPNLIECEPA